MSASSKKKLRKEQNAAELTEKQLNEQKEAKKLRNQTIAFVVAIALVLTIGLGSLAVTAYKTSGITERLSTAMTIGEHELSSAELSYFYLDAINSTYQSWYNQYGQYTATYLSMLYGLDLTKPLNEQMYDEENGKSFADYFIDLAIEDAVGTYTLYDLAVANGHELSEEDMASIEETIKNLEGSMVSSGYNTVSKYLKALYGNGATEKSFRKYLELITTANTFEAEIYDSLTYTNSDLAAYSEENFDDFSSFSYSTYYMATNDFLLCPADKEDEDHEHSQEEQDNALKSTEDAANSIIAAKPANAEDFNKAIKALAPYAEDEAARCTENKDLLYSSIPNEDVAKWLADSSRKAGDMTAIPNISETTDEDGNTSSTTYGLTVVLFQGRNDNEMKLVNVRHILKSFTGATTDELGNTVYPEASIKSSEEFITTLQETWLANGGTEEEFAQLAELNSTDGGSAANGGLYEDIYPGQMVPAFNDWCFDEARQPGDYGIVETEYGFHLMYFVGHSAQTFREYMVENNLRNEDHQKWYQEQVDATEYTVNDTSKLNQGIILAR